MCGFSAFMRLSMRATSNSGIAAGADDAGGSPDSFVDRAKRPE